MDKNNEKRRINRILVPIDFSDYSLNACYFALHLAARHNSGIMLFHAFFNPMVDAMTFPDAFTYQSNMAEVFHELEQNARKEINEFQGKLERYSRLKALGNIRIEEMVSAGQPGDEIENMIKSYKPDLVVIGTRGTGEKSAEMLGSVAGRVIDGTATPLLLVTRDAFLREDDIIRILYATNFDESDFRALDSLVNILAGYSIRLECVHFGVNPGSDERSADQDKLLELKSRFGELHPEVSLGCHYIENKDIITGLDKFVEDNDIELIALTHKKRNLFFRLFKPSLAKKLLFQTKKPVFVFN
jgi:nucleotide-binding universal stress UspA family protein